MNARSFSRAAALKGITGRLLIVVMIVVIPMMALLAVTSIAQIDHARREAAISAQRSAALAGQGATALFASVTDLLLTVSSFPSVQVNDAGRCAFILRQMIAKLEAYSAIAVAGPDGTIICSSAAQLADAKFADATWFVRALRHDGPVIGDMVAQGAMGEPVIHVAQAIRSRFDNVLRVVAISVRVAGLQRYVRGVRTLPGGDVLFIDSSGALMASANAGALGSDPHAVDFLSHLRAEALGANQLPAMVEDVTAGGEDRVYAVQPITALLGAPILAMGFSRSAAAKRELWSALLQGGILLLSTALAIATAIRIGQELIRKPIRELGQAATLVGGGNLDVRLGPPYGSGEIGALGGHFDAMVESLRDYQSELQAVHRRLELLMARLPVGVYRAQWHPHFKVELANEAMSTLLGLPSGGVTQIADHWALVGSGQVERAGLRDDIEAAIRQGRDYDLRYQMVTPDGRMRWFLEKGGPRSTNGTTHIEGLFADITAEKRDEESLRGEYDRLVERSGQAIASIASIIEKRDPYTAGHSRRVTNIATRIAEEMGLNRERVDGLRLAGLVHDIGKISVPIEFLTRPVKLSEAELNVIKQHAASGYDILKGMDWPWPVAQIVRQHHERLDGKGYPDGLQGDQILLEAQILAVADTAEAMTWDRPYRKALPISELERVLMCDQPVLYNHDAATICLKLLRNNSFTHTLYAADGARPPTA